MIYYVNIVLLVTYLLKRTSYLPGTDDRNMRVFSISLYLKDKNINYVLTLRKYPF